MLAVNVVIDWPGCDATALLAPCGEVLLESLLRVEGLFDVRVFSLEFLRRSLSDRRNGACC